MRALSCAAILVGCDMFPQWEEDENGPAIALPAQGTDAPEGAVCRPQRLGLSEGANRERPKSAEVALPGCRLDEQGSVHVEYQTPLMCSAANYRGCIVGIHQDVSGFVKGQGVLEVHVCVEGDLEGAVNLWLEDSRYDQSPSAEGRINLALIDGQEQFGSGCRKRWFDAKDLAFPAACPARQKDVTACDSSPPLPPSDEDAGTDKDAGTDGDAGTEYTFTDSEVQIISEYCASEKFKPQAQVDVQLVSVTYYPNGCLCAKDEDCRDGFCQRDYWPDLACCWCDSSCAGVCAVDPTSQR